VLLVALVLVPHATSRGQEAEETLASVFGNVKDWSEVRVTASDGQLLGNLGPSTASDSVLNDVGQYGSTVGGKSMLNPVGQYGSDVGRFSPTNPVCSRPPVLFVGNRAICYVTANPVKTPRVDLGLLRALPTLRDTLQQKPGVP